MRIPPLKALEQELCEDCISRTEAINAFPDLLSNIGYNKKCITDILQGLPSVQPKTEWIPVTTPPTRNDRYFVTRKCLGKTIVDIVSYSTNLYKVNKSEFYDKKNKGGWWSSDSEYGSYEVDGVIGWQELPMTMESEK